MTSEATKQHPMFDVIYDVRSKIDRVKALEAEKQRTAASFDAAQQNLQEIKSRGQSPTDDDIDRVHQAMRSRTQTRLEQMTIIQEIGASSETIFQLREDYRAYCNDMRRSMKPGEKPPPMASDVLKEIAEVMDLMKTDA